METWEWISESCVSQKVASKQLRIRITWGTVTKCRFLVSMKTFKIRIPVVKPRSANTYEVPLAHLVKNPPAMRETWVQSLGWKNPLEKRKAIHSSILAWRIPWTIHGVAKSRTQMSNFHFHFWRKSSQMNIGFLNVV